MKELQRGWEARKGVVGRGSQMVHLIRQRFQKRPAIVGAEIGVLTGTLSAFMLSHIDELTLYMVDMWDGGYERYNASEKWARENLSDEFGADNLQKAITNTAAYATRRRIIQLRSDRAAKCFEPGSLDFVFIDADHTYEGALADIESYRPAVRFGGLVCGHDYDNGHENAWGVKQAVQKVFGKKVNVGADYVWWVEV